MKINKTDATAIAIIVAMPIAIYLAYKHFGGDWFHNTTNLPGTIGDFLSGVANPILGFGTALLLYFSFRAQIDANQHQKNLFDQEKIYRENKEFIDDLEKRMDAVSAELNTIKYLSQQYPSFAFEGMQAVEQFATEYKGGIPGPAHLNIIDSVSGLMIDLTELGSKILESKVDLMTKFRLWNRFLRLYSTKVAKAVNTILESGKTSGELEIIRDKKSEIIKLIDESQLLYDGVISKNKIPIVKQKNKD